MWTLRKQSKKEQPVVNDELKKEFEKVKEKAIEKPTTRRVLLKSESCCGCGCSTIDFYRTVPFDSDLEDGDFVSSLEENDEII